MYSNIVKKAIILLRYKAMDKKCVDKFIELIKNNQISENQLQYLYNYLYSNTSSILELDYHKGMIILKEVSIINGNPLYKVSAIEDAPELCDIKRTTATIGVNNKKGETLSIKHVYYSLSSCIDLLILSTEAQSGSSDLDIDELTSDLMNNRDYKRISFLSTKDPSLRVYKTYVKKEDDFKEYLTYKYRGLLKLYDGKAPLPPENISRDTKKSVNEIMKFYDNEKEIIMDIKNHNDEYLDTTDPDLLEYFQNFNTTSYFK